MLLQQLVEYRKRLDPIPSAYQKKPVKWNVDLDAHGNLRGITSSVGKEDRNKRGKDHIVPHVLRSSGVASALLVDRADYVLAVPAPGNEARTQHCHSEFVKLVRECATATQEPDVQRVLSFLESLRGQPPQDLPEDLRPGDLVALTIEGRWPSDLSSVRTFWADHLLAKGGHYAQCLVCGRRGPIAERHTVKIKGIPGGQPSGLALVSANASAFESYGLEASLIAPVCVECSQSYAIAINDLLANKNTSYRAGPVSYIFWTRAPEKQGIFRTLTDANPEDVKVLLASPRSGTPSSVGDSDRYYALALSASGGRAVVRDWLEGTVGDAEEHVRTYFRRQHLPGGPKDRSYFNVYSLAASLVPRQAAGGIQDIPPATIPALVRSALRGAPLPSWLVYEAVRRNKAEQWPSRPRLALLKAAIMSRYPRDYEEETMSTEDQKQPAYLCGRLLRILEHAQQAAVNPKVTLVSRYYGSASSAPGSVFGVLLRNGQAHLAKLRTSKPGIHTRLQRQLTEVMAGLERWPRTLSLYEQALFSLGYYHQRMQDFAKAEARAETVAGEGEPADVTSQQ